MALREHEPITIDQFNGLWDRGDIEEVPLDHFTDCNNLQFIGSSGFGTRDGIGPLLEFTGLALSDILRIYNYPTSDRNTLLVLTTGGSIYHVIDSLTIYGPILTIAAMTDFGFVPYNGRAYITPYNSVLVGELNREIGLDGEFLYVYLGDGTNARKAGGASPPTGTHIDVVENAPGAVTVADLGTHLYGIVYETNTGYLTAPASIAAYTRVSDKSTLTFNSIPVSADSFVIARHLVASKAIQNFNGDVNGYDLFFVPGAVINDNTTTHIDNLAWFDQDLIDDASHLFDNFSEIPAGVALCLYHNRLCLSTEFENISLIRVSQIGEPEAISQIDGFCLMPPNGDPITNISELRDVLYAFKRNKTGSFVDNGNEPSSWSYTAIDQGMGCGVHGLATVVDSGSSNIDYLLVGAYTGIVLFNGRYLLPELSWKIASFWNTQSFKTDNRRIQISNDSLLQHLYVVLTDQTMLHADYSNGFDPKKIKWTPWSFDSPVNTIALYNVNQLIIGFGS